jgi:hypothetical protein
MIYLDVRSSNSSNSLSNDVPSDSSDAPLANDEEEQDVGEWESELPEEVSSFVKKYKISKRTCWNFDAKQQLTVSEVNALMEAIKKCPSTKIIRKLSFNFSASEVRIRLYLFYT